MKVNDRVAAVGVGYSTTGRRTGLTSWELGMQAARAALEDAGMAAGDIDGVTLLWGAAGPAPPGLDTVEVMDFGRVMGMGPLNWHGSGGLPAYIGPALEAVAAIRAGFAHTVLTMRIINQRLNTTAEIDSLRAQTGPTAAPGDAAFTAPYGFGVAGMIPSIAALPAQRHMDVFGTTEEQFGAHVVAQRYHATMNPDAIFREPLTIEDYLSSRYIAKPVHLLDCDYPVDSASAVIYTAGDRARDWRPKPVWVESAASSSVAGFSGGFDLIDMNQNSPFHAARELWNRTDLTPADVDCAQLYDGFTIIVFQWLPRLGGSLPVNTDGGACNVGRRHGANFCIESVRQLRGECGERQVPGAEVSVWANAVGPFTGAMLMTADR